MTHKHAADCRHNNTLNQNAPYPHHAKIKPELLREKADERIGIGKRPVTGGKKNLVKLDKDEIPGQANERAYGQQDARRQQAALHDRLVTERACFRAGQQKDETANDDDGQRPQPPPEGVGDHFHIKHVTDFSLGVQWLVGTRQAQFF